jgi:hypothetical protein
MTPPFEKIAMVFCIAVSSASLLVSLALYRKGRHKLRFPKRILIIRHGESTGNVQEEAYKTVPDARLELSEIGKAQSEKLGKDLLHRIGSGSIWVYVS